MPYLWITTASALGTGATDTIANTEWATANLLAVDGANGTNGTSATSLAVTTKAMTLPSYSDGSVTDYSNAHGQLVVYSGIADVTAAATLSAVATGVTGTINTATNTPVSGQPKGYYQITAAASDTGTFAITAVSGGVSLTEVIFVTKVKGGLERVSTLPTATLFDGRVVVLSTDGKIYRYVGTPGSGGAWTAAADGADITPGTVTTNALAAGAVTAAKVSTTSLLTVSAQIGDLTVNTLKIADGSVTQTYFASNGSGFSGIGLSTPGGWYDYGYGPEWVDPVNNTQVIASTNVSMAYAGSIMVMAVTKQNFPSGARYWQYRLRIDGVIQPQVIYAGAIQDSVPILANTDVAAGTRFVEVLWEAQDSTVSIPAGGVGLTIFRRYK